MPSTVPSEGSIVWIRHRRWRVDGARRERDVMRLDVSGDTGRVTFIAPLDRPIAIASRRRPKSLRPSGWCGRLAGRIARSGPARTVFAAIDARIDIRAYQLEPALALLRRSRRVLLADAVGLGKTIQAGLVVAELHRRTPSSRTLIIVPAALVRQWADELRSHFDIDAIAADADAMARLSRSTSQDTPPWRRPGVWLSSLDYLKQPHVFGPAADSAWDLAIIDEAHTVCGHSERHAAAASLARRSRRVLLLTATPHNGDDALFERLMNLGSLPCRDDEIVTFARTRTGPNTRRVRWHTVTLTVAEARLLDGLAAFEREVLKRAGHDRRGAALLVLSVFRKRALSTAAALLASIDRRAAYIRSRLEPAADAEQCCFDFEGDEDRVSADEHAALGADIGLHQQLERSWLDRLRHLARQACADESKIARIRALLQRARFPVIVFTEFRDSLIALRSALEPARPVATVHGGLAADEQERALRRFRTGEADVLLATDVASQGLNLQSRACWVLNLELPWNPVRLEQRAGRVDRIGQTRRVHVGLLVAEHPSEAGLLARLARRALAAERRLGANTLTLTAPDEHAVRVHLLTGADFADSAPVPFPLSTPSCARLGHAVARDVIHRRALAQRDRASCAGDRVLTTPDRRLPSIRALTRGGTLLCFSVPIVDDCGHILERHLLPVHVDRPLAEVLNDASALSEASRRAVHALQPHLRRARHRLEAAAARSADRERAIAGVLTGAAGSPVHQPGLFDRRASRAAEAVRARSGGIHDEVQHRLHALSKASSVAIGVPRLVLATGAGAS